MAGFDKKERLLLDGLISEIDKYKYISFDIFDTALLRNVLSPVDIFDIIGLRINENYKIRNFKQLRIKAEKQARENSCSEDITIYDIYNELSKKTDATVAKNAMEIEFDIERAFLTSNPIIRKAYDYAAENNKQVMFISDMYLPEKFVNDILGANGYAHNHRIYMSGEIGKGKYTGSLYSYVQKEINMPKNQWLHIGDNIHSDYNVPIKYGIKALHYTGPQFLPLLPTKHTLTYSISTAIQINASYHNLESYWKRFGIFNVSPLVWGFVNWICNDLQNRNIKNIYFLSRDGYLPYKIYVQMHSYYNNLPQAHYLYSSRRAYLFGLIGHLSRNEAISILLLHNKQLGQSLSVSDIVGNVGLDINSYGDIMKEFGISKETVLSKNEDVQKTKAFLMHIYDDIMAALSFEQQSLIKYLKTNIADDGDSICLVDVGWKGSVTHSIHKLLNRDITGYFLGIGDDAYPEIKSDIKSYIFKPGENKKLRNFIINNVMMMEFAFSAPQGSLIKFDGAGEPILADIENNNSVKSATHKVCKAVESMCDEYMIYYDYLKDMTPEEAIYNYKSFIEGKKIEDMAEFYNLSAVVGLGEHQLPCPYVTKTTIEEYYDSQKEFILQGKKNLWRDAVILEGNITHLKRGYNFARIYHNDFMRRIMQSRIVRGLMNPGRAVKYMITRLRDQLKKR